MMYMYKYMSVILYVVLPVPGREECSRLGLVPILLRLIKSSSVDNHVRTQILLTLGHCTDSCGEIF